MDFGTGKIIFLDITQKEDMLQVEYPNCFLLDMGWYQDRYIISVIHNFDWTHPVQQYETAENIKSLIEQARYYVKKVGVAIGPNTPVEGKESLFQMCDIVTFMSVEPGQAGSVFCENVLEKIMRFRQITYSWEKKPEICVDGGINLKNAIRCREYGADGIIVGTALFHNDCPEKFITTVRNGG